MILWADIEDPDQTIRMFSTFESALFAYVPKTLLSLVQFVFWSIVKVHIHQNVPKVFVHVFIIDQ